MSAPAAENLKAAAHDYAKRGWRVLPLYHVVDTDTGPVCTCKDGSACKNAGKHPNIKKWQDNASRSGSDIETWWGERPRSGVGIATGEQSGVFGLDVDPDNGGLETLAALEAKHGKLPYTYTVRTGSGGKHLYFTWPGFAVTNSAGKLGAGLDIRGNGGQLVAPPSQSGKGGYVVSVDAPVADAPAWLLDLLRPAEPRTTGGVPVSTEVANHYAAAALAAELDRVRTAPEGTQNNTLNTAAFSLGTLVAVGALDRRHVFEELIAASRDSGYPARDGERAMEDTIASGLDKGELNPRTPWPPVGTAGPTEEEIAAIREIYGENSPEMDWLVHDFSSNGNGAGTTREPVGTGGNHPGTTDCDHDRPDVQAHIDALLGGHPDLARSLARTIPFPDFLPAAQQELIEIYRSAAGPQESVAGACALLRRHRATLDCPHPRGESPCDVANYWFTAKPLAVKPSSWAPMDLTAILDGTAEPEEPTLLARADGQCLLYPGRVHWVQGEPESGKSLVVQYEVAQLLTNGGTAVYIDNEMGAAAAVGRLLSFGVSRDNIRRGLRYIRPDVGPGKEPIAFLALLSSTADLVVIDGVTEALGLDGFSVNDNDQVAKWMRDVPRKLAERTGAAVVCVDHVIKNGGGGGRFAIGAQAKQAGVDGAVYTVEPLKPMGRGLCGEVMLRIGKDRPGAVRPHCGAYREKDRTQEAARIIFDSDPETYDLTVTVQTPEGASTADQETGGMKRRTWIMEQVSKLAEGFPDGITIKQTRDSAGCRHEFVRDALKVLKIEGYVETRPHGTNSYYPRWFSIKPYRQKNDPLRKDTEGPSE